MVGAACCGLLPTTYYLLRKKKEGPRHEGEWCRKQAPFGGASRGEGDERNGVGETMPGPGDEAAPPGGGFGRRGGTGCLVEPPDAGSGGKAEQPEAWPSGTTRFLAARSGRFIKVSHPCPMNIGVRGERLESGETGNRAKRGNEGDARRPEF